jgi:hypothetical protein
MPTRRLPDPIILDDEVTSSSGKINVGPTTYTFPVADGGAGQVLTTTGNGALVWQPATTGGSSSLNPKDVFTHYTVAASDNFIRYRGVTSGTLMLPDGAAYPGRQLLIENQSLQGAQVTIACSGADTIDGDSLLFTLDDRFASASLVSDGLGNWLLI